MCSKALSPSTASGRGVLRRVNTDEEGLDTLSNDSILGGGFRATEAASKSTQANPPGIAERCVFVRGRMQQVGLYSSLRSMWREDERACVSQTLPYTVKCPSKTVQNSDNHRVSE